MYDIQSVVQVLPESTFRNRFLQVDVGRSDDSRVYLNAFETGSEARNGIGNWISYYNEKRPHSSHGLLTPGEAYDSRTQNPKAAA